MILIIPLYLLICTAIGALAGSAIIGLIVGATPLIIGGSILLLVFVDEEINKSKRRRAKIKLARERQGLPAKPPKRRP